MWYTKTNSNDYSKLFGMIMELNVDCFDDGVNK